MKTSLVILASVLLVVGLFSVAVATEKTAPVEASVTVPGFLSITTASDIVFPEISQGESGEANLVVNVTSNADYQVESKADQANFNKGGETDTTIPASDLKWGDGETTEGFNSYTESFVELRTGGHPGEEHTINHELTIPESAESATYSLPITVKATQV